ncbi:MAG: alpha/beta fold hydrolase [Deltaproteobacteria bacterium]|nr:alpha/beta fold hydrolase [Deltaproteobacteria bacterium]
MSDFPVEPRTHSQRRRRGGPLGLARLAVDRMVLSAVHGFVYATDGVSRAQRGTARKETVFQRGKLALHHVLPLEPFEFEIGTERVSHGLELHPTPIVLVPPLMVRPYIFDLRPDHSMVRTLRKEGFDVYVVDFGVPDEDDEEVRLDDYVLDYVPTCIDEALRHSGRPQVSIAGYCMGGIFGMLHLGAHRDRRIKNLVTIGSPVAFDEMGIISFLSVLGGKVIDPVMDVMGNVPSELVELGFKLLGGPKMLTRYVDLVTNLWDYEFLRGFDSISAWGSDFIPYPREAFKQMVKELAAGDKMRRGELTFGDKRVDLKAIECPVLAFAGKTDDIATLSATRAILEHLGSRDLEFREVPGGHIGVVAGSQAEQAVWRPMAEWLRAR